MNKTAEEIRNQFEAETGKGWMVIPVTHGENGYASWEYQLWLEQRVAKLSAPQQPVPQQTGLLTAKEFWRDKFGEYPKNDAEKLAVAMMAEYKLYATTSPPIK